ncbi:hypothetical protein OG458_43010 (plasmid) [Streptomyces sp. NBC_01281]|uniref:hypothetical protein n=1 Tax=Streptomyces sp. NBC_01281 TaxID=2903811 RepID=UPI002E109824|nr:hypothetical protein OG458_43010 [Streptomyces sp. NBC_01281]
MGSKKRAAIAVGVSSAAGTAAGLTAAHFGLDATESTRIGVAVSGAVGDLLFKALRLTREDNPVGETRSVHGPSASTDDSSASTTEVTNTVIEGSVEEEKEVAVSEDTSRAESSGTETEKYTVDASDNTNNATGGQRDTADTASAPDRGMPRDPKHPRHRKRRRAADRRIERHQRYEKEEGNTP